MVSHVPADTGLEAVIVHVAGVEDVAAVLITQLVISVPNVHPGEAVADVFGVTG
jgi:hypothetical protein